MEGASASRYRTIIGLGLPIVGGMISQNILNLVDTAMVGTLGDAALAAVGTGSFVNFMAIAVFMGFSSGVQAMVARRKGEGRESELALPLNGALLVIACCALPWSVILYGVAPFAFPFLNPDPAVIEAGVPYLQARLLSATAIGMNYSFRGYWNGVNRPGFYLRTLLVMHVVNIGLNWVLIFGNLGAPQMGAEGAGIASAISTYVGTAYYVIQGVSHARPNGFLAGLPSRETIRTMLRVSVPTSIQQLLFSAGYTALFWILGRVGTAETAAANVLINVTLVAILPGIALGIASASLVGQALGRGDPEDARRWAWNVVKVALVVIGAIGLPMLAFPDAILGIFIHDAETLALARLPLRIFAIALPLDAVGLVLMQSLLGAGAARSSMLVSVGCQWFLFLPLAYLVGPVLGYGLVGIWLVQVLYRLIQAGLFVAIWRRGSWAHVKV